MRLFSKRERNLGHGTRYTFLVLLSLVASLTTYSIVRSLLAPGQIPHIEDTHGVVNHPGARRSSEVEKLEAIEEEKSNSSSTNSEKDDESSFCRGIDSFELWGAPVKWGNQNLKESPAECCQQCKEMCTSDSTCECNSWVYCGNQQKCGESYKQCWLKKQSDFIFPEVHSTDSPWMSGLVHPKGKAFVCLKTETDCIRIQLEPSWAPLTVRYILDVQRLRHCTGCQFYRAEKFDGSDLSLPGTPQALLQGSLLTEGIFFKPIPQESTPVVRRGYVCLIEGGPDFFIALADHLEWGHSHTVFARVLEEDMPKIQKIVDEQPTKPENWGPDVDVQVLVNPINFIIAKTEQ